MKLFLWIWCKLKFQIKSSNFSSSILLKYVLNIKCVKAFYMYEWIMDTIVTLVMAGFRSGSDPISYSLAAVIGTWNLHKREAGGKSIVWYSIIIALSQTTGVWRERKRAISHYNDLLNRSPISIGFFVFTLMTLNTFRNPFLKEEALCPDSSLDCKAT